VIDGPTTGVGSISNMSQGVFMPPAVSDGKSQTC
jgi:hypothetical protein